MSLLREETGAILCCDTDGCNSGSGLDQGEITCYKCGNPNQPDCEEGEARPDSSVVGCHGYCFVRIHT